MTARQALGQVLQGQAAFASTQDEDVCWMQALSADRVPVLSMIKIKDDYEPITQRRRPVTVMDLRVFP
jgi:hypothetical protein